MKRNFYGSPIFIDTIWFPEAGISFKKVFLERNLFGWSLIITE